MISPPLNPFAYSKCAGAQFVPEAGDSPPVDSVENHNCQETAPVEPRSAFIKNEID